MRALTFASDSSASAAGGHLAVEQQRANLKQSTALPHDSTMNAGAEGRARLAVGQVPDGPVQGGAQAQQPLHGLLQLAHREGQEGRVPGACVGLPAWTMPCQSVTLQMSLAMTIVPDTWRPPVHMPAWRPLPCTRDNASDLAHEQG